MRRRKLLISIGALGAGGTAAFGTEAFTSVEAERNVDVTVADDADAFLAIQPLSGNNANQYVSEEANDNTVALDFDDENPTDTGGEGVNQDAVTQVEDLFKIVNQGTQPTSVFFEDGSDADAVTFRVTSTDIITQGSNGDSLEGEDRSVELETGEQVAVGLTIDTLNNDVSGTLVNDVTIRAESEASVSGQNNPERIVAETDDDLDGRPGFTSIQDAIDGNNPKNDAATEEITGGTVLVENGTYDESVEIDVESLTLEGAGADSATIAPADGKVAADINAADVTIDRLALEATDARVIRNDRSDSGDLTVRNADLTLEADDGTTGEKSAIKMDAKDGDPGVGVLEVTNTDFTAINSDTSEGSLIGVKILQDPAEGSKFTDLTFTGDFASGINATAVDSVTVTDTTFKDIDAGDSPFLSGAPISIIGDRSEAITIDDWTIENNQFDNVSMPVGGGIYAAPDGGTIDISANQNNFDVSTGIVTFRTKEGSEVSIDVTNNWWGNASGPDGEVEGGEVKDPSTGAIADGSGAQIINQASVNPGEGETVAFDPFADEAFEDAGADD